MLYSMLLVTITFITTSWASSSCGLDDQNMMQDMFSNCTQKWKTEYNMAVAVKKEEVQSVTCRLVENIVETCGDEWRQCHGEEDVRRMKDMHVESLLHKNRGAVVDIEQCHTVKQFRSRHTLYEDPASCSDDETVESQEEFQNCTHSITTSVNDNIQSINSIKSISRLFCQAISSISSDCVKHLEKCLDAEDVFIMSESHIEQLKVFFISLAGDKVGGDFGLDNCQEPLEDLGTSNKDIRNTVEDDFNEEDYNFEESVETKETSDPNHFINDDMKVKEQTKHIDVRESQEMGNDSYVEMEMQEQPLKIVSKKSDDVSIASHVVHMNLNVSLFIFSILFFYNKF